MKELHTSHLAQLAQLAPLALFDVKRRLHGMEELEAQPCEVLRGLRGIPEEAIGAVG